MTKKLRGSSVSTSRAPAGRKQRIGFEPPDEDASPASETLEYGGCECAEGGEELDTRCAKCGNAESVVMYLRKKKRMAILCARCGYQWTADPLG